MKRILIIIATLFATAQSQTIQTIGAPTTTVVSRGNFRTDSIFYLPKRQKLPTDSGAVRYQISDSSVYYWTGFQWRRLGVHIDTAAMLLPYLRDADTTAMLSPYLKESDTVWLSNRINLKVNIADTSSMLSPYLRRTDTTAMLTPYLRRADTTAMLSPYARTATVNAQLATKLNISDTASMLVPYLRDADTATLSSRIEQRVKYTDTAAMLTPYLRRADTTAMLSPYARTATVNAQLATKVNISDTSSMLNPYLRKVDTTAMLSPYARTSNVNASLALKLNISDTATMLSPYLKESDTAFLSNRINLKVNISDTSSMLTNYIRHAGNGLTKSGQSLSVDTAAIATRARVQKAVDSLNGVIATKGSGTVTSVATGYGLSGGTITTTGTIIVDSAIVASRLRVGKVVDSLALVKQNVLTNPVTGTGTTNYVPKFTGTSTIGNSLIFDNGTNVGINNTSPSQKLDISGNINMGGTSWFRYENGGGYFGSATTTSNGYARETAIRADSTLIFASGGSTERMRITASGEILVNTFTDAGDYKLQVSGNAYVYNASAGSAVVSMMGGARAGALGLKIFNETIAQSTIIALGEESGTSSTPFFIRRYGSTNANASAVEIVNGQNAAMWLSTNSTERIRLHANGGLKFVGQSAAPTAEAGTVYYDTDDNKLKVYNGTTWVDLH